MPRPPLKALAGYVPGHMSKLAVPPVLELSTPSPAFLGALAGVRGEEGPAPEAHPGRSEGAVGVGHPLLVDIQTQDSRDTRRGIFPMNPCRIEGRISGDGGHVTPEGEGDQEEQSVESAVGGLQDVDYEDEDF